MTNLSDCLTSATLEVYGKVEREMLPTPSRPHYTFNLRDISKVVQASGSRVSVSTLWIKFCSGLVGVEPTFDTETLLIYLLRVKILLARTSHSTMLIATPTLCWESHLRFLQLHFMLPTISCCLAGNFVGKAPECPISGRHGPAVDA